MFRIVINGETVETVMYDDFGDVQRYAFEEYPDEDISLVRIE